MTLLSMQSNPCHMTFKKQCCYGFDLGVCFPRMPTASTKWSVFDFVNCLLMQYAPNQLSKGQESSSRPLRRYVHCDGTSIVAVRPLRRYVLCDDTSIATVCPLRRYVHCDGTSIATVCPLRRYVHCDGTTSCSVNPFYNNVPSDATQTKQSPLGCKSNHVQSIAPLHLKHNNNQRHSVSDNCFV